MAIDLKLPTDRHCPPGPEPALLVSSALHLMTHYSAHAGDAGERVNLASVIERHLKALAGQMELNPVLRATCQQLSEHWEELVNRPRPLPPAPSRGLSGLVGLFSLLARAARSR